VSYICLDAFTGTKVASDGAVKDFHHETEESTSECCVPSTFGGFIANEGVLGLDLEEGTRDILVFKFFADEVTTCTRDVRILWSIQSGGVHSCNPP